MQPHTDLVLEIELTVEPSPGQQLSDRADLPLPSNRANDLPIIISKPQMPESDFDSYPPRHLPRKYVIPTIKPGF